MEIDEVLEFENPKTLKFSKEVWGWAIYDFANTIFSMNIVTLYFAPWIIIDKGMEDIWYSITFSTAMFLGALTMPPLGAVSDAAGNKKSYLLYLTLVCIIATFLVGVVSISNFSSQILLALLFFGAAVFCYEGSLVFYNALLTDVAPARKIGQVSGLGVSLGYVGAIIGMLLVLPFVQGKIFAGTGNQQAFIPTAVFFLLFCIPTFLWVKEKSVSHPAKIKIKQSFKEVWDGIANTKKYPGVLRFLISNFFFGDAIATVILFMAVYAQLVMGFSETGKIWLFMVSTLSAAIGSLLCGWVCDKIGSKKSLSLVLLAWFFSLTAVIFITDQIWFWIMGSVVGILLGSVWTASRPLLTDLVPQSKMGQFFSLYSLFGRVAAIVGPLIWGLVVLYFKKDFFLVKNVVSFLRSIGIEISQSVLSTIQYRFAIFSLALMMLVGWWILLKVPNKFEKE